MSIDKREKALELLLQAFEIPYNFFVLGAGTSANIIPMTHQMEDKIIERHLNFWILKTTPTIPNNLFVRIIRNEKKYSDPYTLAKIRMIPNGMIYAMACKLLSPEKLISFIPQYDIFHYISKPSIIFNMNLDGITKKICHGHFILEPHGTIPSEIVHSKWWEEVIDYLHESDDAPFQIPGILLPNTEPKNITNKQEYTFTVNICQWQLFLG